MKQLWIVSAFLGALWLTGCSPSSTSNRDGQSKANASKAEVEAFQKELKEQLDKLDKECADWKAKAAVATGEAKEKMETRLAELEKHKGKVKEQLSKLEGVGAELWQATKQESQKALDELKGAQEKAKEYFK